VISFESESSQNHKPFESESSQSYLNFFRFESSQSHDLVESRQSLDLVESSQSRVTWTVESLQVIALQARVNVESHVISRFSTTFFCYEMAPNMLQNGAR